MGTNVFKLNADGQYRIIDYIKSDEEINAETEAKIRQKYSINDELKLNRTANASDASAAGFAEYNTYVETCRAEGATKKQSAATARAALTEIEIDNGGMKTKIMVKT